MDKVLFSTKCWERDYAILAADEFHRKHELCSFPFAERWMMVNNVREPERVRSLFEDQADRVVCVEDYKQEVLDFFGLQEEDFEGGYVYSICELAELYLAEDFDYVVHFSSDSGMAAEGDWITPSIQRMGGCIVACSPQYPGYQNEKITQNLSDQVYIVPVQVFRQRVYSYSEPKLSYFPAHGGESFERRATRFLHNSYKWKSFIEEHAYLHPVF